MIMKVPQFEPFMGTEEYIAIKDCFDKNWITEGPKMKEFSSLLCGLMGAEFAVFAPNGTLALYLGLRSIGIKPGDEVIVPDFTFIGSATSVEMAGAVPVFADVNRDNFQIDIDSCEKYLTEKTKAIMPVHMYGMAANMSGVLNFAKRHNLLVIEDAAQAVGVRYNGKHCGTFGDVGCFSFFADKTITTGEGGFVVAKNEKIYKDLLYLRNQGRLERGSFIHPQMGYNFRMTDIQLAVGIVQFGKLPEIIEKKSRIIGLYREKLGNVEEIQFTKVEPGSTHIPFRVAVICKDAHRLMDSLSKKGIEGRTFFYPLHRQPCFQYLKDKGQNSQVLEDAQFPNAVYGYENGMCLPSFVGITEEQINYVCENIKAFYAE
ncbi:MAG: hypothetical protein CVU78_01230 [Elusimicrobia bacterium HGW-Elusimicrobia-2]|nr:MAG: hypothetical protein CVU78_01230 [Elusimicrobia bacterium HGW-Elusimicrobia-2]